MSMSMRLTLAKRIASGIIFMLILMVVVGVVGYFGLMRVLGVMEHYQEINKLERVVSSTKEMTDQFYLAGYSGEAEFREIARKKTNAYLRQGIAIVKDLEVNSDLRSETIEKLRLAGKAMGEYVNLFDGYLKVLCDFSFRQVGTLIRHLFSA